MAKDPFAAFADAPAAATPPAAQDPFAQFKDAPTDGFDQFKDAPQKKTAQELADDPSFNEITHLAQNPRDAQTAEEVAWLRHQKPYTVSGAANAAGQLVQGAVTEGIPAIAQIVRGYGKGAANAARLGYGWMQGRTPSNDPEAARQMREMTAAAALGTTATLKMADSAAEKAKRFARAVPGLSPHIAPFVGKETTRDEVAKHLHQQAAYTAEMQKLGKGELPTDTGLATPYERALYGISPTPTFENDEQRAQFERNIEDLSEGPFDPTNLPVIGAVGIPAKIGGKIAGTALKYGGKAAEKAAGVVASGVETAAKNKIARATTPTMLGADVLLTGGAHTAAAATAAATGAGTWAGAKMAAGLGRMAREAGEEMTGAAFPARNQSFYRKITKEGMKGAAAGTVAGAPMALGAETPYEAGAMVGSGTALGGTVGILHPRLRSTEANAHFGAMVEDGRMANYNDANDQRHAGFVAALPQAAQDVVNYYRGYFNGATTPDGNPVRVEAMDADTFVQETGQKSRGVFFKDGRLLVNVGRNENGVFVPKTEAEIAATFAHEGKHALDQALEASQPGVHKEIFDALRKRFTEGDGVTATPEFLEWIDGQVTALAQNQYDALIKQGMSEADAIQTIEQTLHDQEYGDTEYWLNEASADIGQGLITGSDLGSFMLTPGMQGKIMDGIRDAATKLGINIPGDNASGQLNLPNAQAATRAIRQQLYASGAEARARLEAREVKRAQGTTEGDRLAELTPIASRPITADTPTSEAEETRKARRALAELQKELGAQTEPFPAAGAPPTAPSAPSAVVSPDAVVADAVNALGVMGLNKTKANALIRMANQQHGSPINDAGRLTAAAFRIHGGGTVKPGEFTPKPTGPATPVAAPAPGTTFRDETGTTRNVTGTSPDAPRVGDIVITREGEIRRVTRVVGDTIDTARPIDPLTARGTKTHKPGDVATLTHDYAPPAPAPAAAPAPQPTSQPGAGSVASTPSADAGKTPAGAPGSPAEPTVAPAVPALAVASGPGGSFIIVDAAGNPINKNTYRTEADANQAIRQQGKGKFRLPPPAVDDAGNEIPDILDAIFEHGGGGIFFGSMGKEERQQSVPQHIRALLGSDNPRNAPDAVAQRLFGSAEEQAQGIPSFGDGTAETMFAEINRALDARRSNRKQTAQEAAKQRLAEREARNNPPTNEATPPPDEPLPQGPTVATAEPPTPDAPTQPSEISRGEIDQIAALARETFLADKTPAKSGPNRGQHTKENQKAADRAAFQAVAEAHAERLPANYEGIKLTESPMGEPEVSGTIKPGRAFDDYILELAGIPEGDPRRDTINTIQNRIGDTVSIEYAHAAGREGEPNYRATRRAAQKNDPAKGRIQRGNAQTETKVFLPQKMKFNFGTRTITTLGTNAEKLAANYAWAEEAMQAAGEEMPYRGVHDPKLVADLKGLQANHDAGYTWDGYPITGLTDRPLATNRPQGEGAPYQGFMDEDGMPDLQRFEFVNLLLGNEGARVGKRGETPIQKGKLTLGIQNRGEVSDPVTAEGETNQLRDRLNAALGPQELLDANGQPTWKTDRWSATFLEDPLNEALLVDNIERINPTVERGESPLHEHAYKGDLDRFLGKLKPGNTEQERIAAAARFMPEDDAGYRGHHSAPMRDSGSPLSDLSATYPEDIYSANGARYYGHWGDERDRASIAIIQSFRGRPRANIRIFRAVPKDITVADKITSIYNQKAYIQKHGNLPPNVKTNQTRSQYYDAIAEELKRLEALPPEKKKAPLKINPGDWVTIDRNYAKEHGEATLGGQYRIISKVVKARDIFTNGDSIHEWGYDPQESVIKKTEGGNFMPEDSYRSRAQSRIEDRRRAEETLKRKLGDAYRYLTQKEKDQEIEALLRKPRRYMPETPEGKAKVRQQFSRADWKARMGTEFTRKAAWLTPDARWINVGAHTEAIPEGAGYGDMFGTGFARVKIDGGKLYLEHPNPSQKQIQQAKDAAIEKGLTFTRDTARQPAGAFMPEDGQEPKTSAPSKHERDPYTRQQTRITTRIVSADTSRELAETLRQIHLGREQWAGPRTFPLLEDAPYSEDSDVRGVLQPATRNSGTSMGANTPLVLVGHGIEARVFRSPEGAVYKVFLQGHAGGIGLRKVVERADDGTYLAKTQNGTQDSLIEKLYVLSKSGGIPSEIQGRLPNGSIVVKQPFAPKNIRGDAQAIEAQSKGLIKRIPQEEGSDLSRDYVTVVDGAPYLISDLRLPNFMEDNSERPRVIDLVVGKIPEDVIASLPELRASIKDLQAEEKKRNRADTSFMPEVPASRKTDDRIQMSNASITRGPTMQFLPEPLHHGAPHEVDKFKTEKIGTGEGAQAYGFGLYFAQNRNVAEEYARNLTPELTVKGKPGIRRGEVHGLHAAMDSLGDLQYALSQIKYGTFDNAASRPIIDRAMKRLDDATKFSSPGSAAYEAAEKVANWWFSLGDPATIKPEDVEHSVGNLYTVRVKPEHDTLLDWDRPLSEQSEHVKAALAQLLTERQEKAREAAKASGKEWGKLADPEWSAADELNTNGALLYRRIAADLSGEKGLDAYKAASEKLASLGIAGIRYADQGSRGVKWKVTKAWHPEKGQRWRAKDGDFGESDYFDSEEAANAWVKSQTTSNFVIFNENDIEITHKNGKPVTAEERKEALGEQKGGSFMPETPREKAKERIKNRTWKEYDGLEEDEKRRPFRSWGETSRGELVGYRGNGSGMNAPTEGAGMYIARDRGLSDQFGDGTSKAIHFKPPANPLIAPPTEPLHILHESDEIAQLIQKSDSDWTRLNKQAYRDITGGDDAKWDASAVGNRLGELAIKEGFDAIYIPHGPENNWVVLLKPKQQVTRGSFMPETDQQNIVTVGRAEGREGVFYGSRVATRITELPGTGPNVRWIEGTQHDGDAGDAPVADAVNFGLIEIPPPLRDMIHGKDLSDSTWDTDLVGILSLKAQGIDVAHFPSKDDPSKIVSIDLRNLDWKRALNELRDNLVPSGKGDTHRFMPDILKQVGGTIEGKDGFWAVIPPDDEPNPEFADLPPDDEPIAEGPWKTRQEAQDFIDSEVGSPRVRIVEVRNGQPTNNPFVEHMRSANPDQDTARKARVASAKKEILEDIESGDIPKTVRSFTELHDYVDANEYVNDANRKDRIIGPLGKSLGWKTQQYADFTNEIIGELDSWLKSGRMEARNHKDAARQRLKDSESAPFTGTAWHGSNEDFDTFDENKIGQNTGSSDYAEGFYLSKNREDAGYGKNVNQWTVDLKRPLRTNLLPDEFSEKYGDGEQARKTLEAQGYDGIIAGDQIIAFRKGQLARRPTAKSR